MTLTRVIVFFLILNGLGLVACHQPSVSEVLKEAQTILEQNPDSAALLLEERIIPVSLTDRDKADYWYLLTFAHIMQGRSLVCDSLVNYSVNYYREHGNTHRLFNACRLAAWQSKWGDRDKQQQEQLWIEAVLVAEAENNQAYLSDAYRHLSNFYTDEKHYQKAIDVCWKKETLSSKDQATAWYTIGLNYGRMSMTDSCHTYMAKAARLAYDIKSENAFHYLRNYAEFLSAEAPEEALFLLNQTRSLFPERSLNLSYATVYKALDEMDSAIVYLNKAKADKHVGELSEASWQVYLKALEMIWQGENKQSYDLRNLAFYCDSVSEAMMYSLQNEKELMFAQKRLLQDNLKIETSRQRTLFILFALLFFCTVVGGVSFYSIRHRRDKLIEAEEMLESLQQLLREATASAQITSDDMPTQSNNIFFRKVLLQQLGIIRLVATSPSLHNKELLQQMSRIANDDVPTEALLVWNDLYPIIDTVYDNFYSRLIALAAGRLSEKELQLCCLLCAGFSTKEISVVSQQSVRTIYQRKTNIRHALGMDEKDDIVRYIQSAGYPLI